MRSLNLYLDRAYRVFDLKDEAVNAQRKQYPNEVHGLISIAYTYIPLMDEKSA